MAQPRVVILALVALAACVSPEPVDRPGGQSGSLKEELPQPEDVGTLDFERATVEAVRLALAADLVAPWRGHIDLLSRSDGECPNLFIGQPEDAMTGDEDNLSWEGTCTSGALDFEGFMTWDLTVEADSASREASGDARMFDDGELSLEFDGEANDSVSWTPDGGFAYSSTVEGQFSGPLVYGNSSPVPGGFRGASEISYGSDGTIHVAANLYLFGDPLLDRFDAIVVDIDIDEGCPEEPVGYVGLRGNDGYWFDIFFLPRYAEDDISAVAGAFPYELIDNPTCDGCGNLFVRNVPSDQPNLVCPDFGSATSELSAPSVDEYILTLHDLPWDSE